MLVKLFYGNNFWIFFSVSLLIFLVVFEIGYRFGKRQSGKIDEETKTWTATIDEAILMMLSLLLAFSFGMSEHRFDARKQLVVDEANAIGTTYLRSQWLPEPHRTEIARLLREYVDIRLPKDPGLPNVDEDLRPMVARADQLQDQLWAHGVEIAKKQAVSPLAALFLAALNDMVDLQTKRLAAFRNRVPEIILLLLYIFAGFSVLVTGYVSGFRGPRSSLAVFTLIGLLTLFLVVIVDLDRPQRGLITVSQESLIQLQQKLHADPLQGIK